MNRARAFLVGLVVFGFSVADPASASEPPHVWVVDPHVKVFRDTPPAAAPGKIVLRAARRGT